jgi:hypothetical protein
MEFVMSAARLLAVLTAFLAAGCGSGDSASIAGKDGQALVQLSKPAERSGAAIVMQGGGARVDAAGDVTRQLLKDPGFEGGARGWTASRAVIDGGSGAAHDGTALAHLAGYNRADDELYQDVTIAPNASSATLTFWYAVASSEAGVNPGGDQMTVAVHDPASGAQLGLLARYTNASVTKAWTPSAAFDLSAYAGKTVRLRFHGTSDAAGKTSFAVDDVALRVVTPVAARAAVYSSSAAAATVVPRLPGARAEYEVSLDNGRLVFTNTGRALRYPVPAGVQRLQFDDVTVALDTDGLPGKVYRLYKAAFDRAPDAGGLGFWIDNAERMPLTMEQMAGFFMDSDEFRKRYGNPDHRNFVQQVYRNALHREGEAAGIDFYLDFLNKGTISRAQVLTSFSESPENQAQVQASIAHGVAYLLPEPSCPATQVAVRGACVERVRVTATQPADGGTSATTGSIRIAFSGAMDTSSQPMSAGAITVTPALPGFVEKWDSSGTVWQLEPPQNWPETYQGQLKPYTRYTVSLLAKGVKAASGAAVDSPTTFSFTTGPCSSGTEQNLNCVPVCEAPKILFGGDCVMPQNPTCPSGKVLQNDRCVKAPPVCVLPQVLQNGVCVTPPAPTCVLPKVLVNGVCTTPAPVVCAAPKVLVDGVCTTPAPATCVAPKVLVDGVCTTPAPVTCVSPKVLVDGVCTSPAPVTCEPPKVLVNGVCTTPAPVTCTPPKVLVNGVCTTPSTPPGLSTTPDKDGCYVPQRSPACLTVSQSTVGTELQLVYTSRCAAHVFVRSCIKRKNGSNWCGAGGVDPGKKFYWSSTTGVSSTYYFVGSVKPDNDFVCSARDPGMTAYKNANQ